MNTEYMESLHARLVGEVRELQEQAVTMRRRFVNAWMHHPEYCGRLTTLPDWAAARGVTRHAAYALRRRHSGFPPPMGRFGGAVIYNREALDSWFESRRPGAAHNG